MQGISEWSNNKMATCPQFQYCETARQTELLDLRLMRSMREGNLPLYIKAPTEIAERCFSLDHFNYGRWLSVHIPDLLNLEITHPVLYKLSMEGYYVVAKTGGILGQTENESALRRWMVANPEISCVINEFEACFRISSNSCDNKHHDQTPSIQYR